MAARDEQAMASFAFPVNGEANFAGASDSGADVIFDTTQSLSGRDTPACSHRWLGTYAEICTPDVYAIRGGHSSLVAASPRRDTQSETWFAGVSADGQHVFFETHDRLRGSDHDQSLDIYERYRGKLRLISTGSLPRSRTYPPYFHTSSDDGRHVFFETRQRLIPGDKDQANDIYERFEGETRLVSTDLGPDESKGASFLGSSADGGTVFFGLGRYAHRRIYSRSNATTTLLATGEFGGIARDGSSLFFSTTESLSPLDVDEGKLDVYEVSGAGTKLSSTGIGSIDAAFGARFAGASEDGEHVFFYTEEGFLTTDSSPGRDGNEQVDIYERSAGTTERVTADRPDVDNEDAPYFEFLGSSPRGERSFFWTDGRLVAADTDETFDIYERFNGVTRIASVGPMGGNGEFDVMPAGEFLSDTGPFHRKPVHGERVFFETDESLVAQDKDRSYDAYSWRGGSIELISTGPRDSKRKRQPLAWLAGASTDGSRAFFETGAPLVRADRDTFQDVYERHNGRTRLISR